jgi:hypothetical protein
VIRTDLEIAKLYLDKGHQRDAILRFYQHFDDLTEENVHAYYRRLKEADTPNRSYVAEQLLRLAAKMGITISRSSEMDQDADANKKRAAALAEAMRPAREARERKDSLTRTIGAIFALVVVGGACFVFFAFWNWLFPWGTSQDLAGEKFTVATDVLLCADSAESADDMNTSWSPGDKARAWRKGGALTLSRGWEIEVGYATRRGLSDYTSVSVNRVGRYEAGAGRECWFASDDLRGDIASGELRPAGTSPAPPSV